MGKYKNLERLQKLKESGALTEDEFQREKEKILNKDNANNIKTNKNISKTDNEKPKEERKISWRKYIKIYVILFIVLFLIALSPVVISGIQRKQNEKLKVSVPNLIGKTYEEAENVLSDLGLKIDTMSGSSDNKDSIVTEQERKEGYALIKGDTLRVKTLTQEEFEKKKQEEEEKIKEQEEAREKGYKKSLASEDTIISCAKTLISNELRSSNTAVWGKSELVDQDNYGRCLVYVDLEAQNSFGAYSKLNYLVVLQSVEYDGHFTYSPYIYRYELVTYGATTPYNYYVGAYKSGEIYPVIKEFLENNKWNTRPKEEETKTDAPESTNNDTKQDTPSDTVKNEPKEQTTSIPPKSTTTTSTAPEKTKEMVEVPYFSMGFELEEYTKALDELKIPYKVVKGQDLEYENNTVIKIEHNGERIEKGTTITITVADNVYDMDITVSTEYLLELAGLGYDYEEVTLSLKINGKSIFNGKLPVVNSINAIKCGTFKGKPENLKIEATIEGKSITKKINYVFWSQKQYGTSTIVIYEGGSIGLG